MSVSGHLTFKAVSIIFLIAQSLRPKKVIPAKETLTAYVLYRLSSKFRWTEKKFISHWPFGEYRPKIKFKCLSKVENDGETLGNLYVMFNGPLRIYEDYKIEA